VTGGVTTGEVSLPRWRFRLAGKWFSIELNDDAARRRSIKDLVEEQVGKAEENATLRALMRRRVETGAVAARDAQAQGMFIATEVSPGLAMPVTLTVYAPSDLHMSPAVGTAPETVISMLEKSFVTLEMEGNDTATRLSLGQAEVLRLHRYASPPPDEHAPETVRNLIVDYWCTVPGSKRVVLANFFTPLSDITNVMLEYFDGVVRASYFEAESQAAAQAAVV